MYSYDFNMDIKWISFPDARLTVYGLPWFQENKPLLWRLPRSATGSLPAGVEDLMRCPSGARIGFVTNSSELRLRVHSTGLRSMSNMSALGCRGLDVYVDGAYWCASFVDREGEQELLFFSGAERGSREVVIHLPTFQEIMVLEAGVDADASMAAMTPYAPGPPVVYYGSSVAQGGCSSRPGMTYSAMLGRATGRDFVNLGFSGAGKGEPEVVRLMTQIEAACFVLDVGKSYGRQDIETFSTMLEIIRRKHAQTPIVCVTPIWSTREIFDKEYASLSNHVRSVIRTAVSRRAGEGDRRVWLAEGEDLLGPDDADAYSDGVHPTDMGFERIAKRIEPLLRRVFDGNN